ncbi:PAB-dependent poly(A)-specific ribonuclease subunit 3 [Irineochytrium annulatum]|nr:PAB-dependent poly(A)-specific ribonuclease subunit 3 [Irineochytrium annulatum]
MQALRLPLELAGFYSLFPLEDLSTERRAASFGQPSFVYKAIGAMDGKPYALRRIDGEIMIVNNYGGMRIINDAAFGGIEGWRRIRHPNIVSLREVFSTPAFGDNSLVFVYDYHPLSETLQAKHFASASGGPIVVAPVAEKVIWSYVAQIVSALKTIHSAGLASHAMDPTKIILTSRNRIRLNGCGIYDVLNYDGSQGLANAQHDDLIHFGHLVVALACGSLQAINNLPQSIEMLTHSHSADLKNMVLYLLSKPSNVKTIDDVIAMIGPRILHEINNTHQLDMDPSWSETGDRYLLKLFRDYVFHQVDENGKAVVDLVHSLTCLNKLEVGLDEKIMLTSRDDQSCLIVSYKDLKQCLNSSFQSLLV